MPNSNTTENTRAAGLQQIVAKFHKQPLANLGNITISAGLIATIFSWRADIDTRTSLAEMRLADFKEQQMEIVRTTRADIADIKATIRQMEQQLAQAKPMSGAP